MTNGPENPLRYDAKNSEKKVLDYPLGLEQLVTRGQDHVRCEASLLQAGGQAPPLSRDGIGCRDVHLLELLGKDVREDGEDDNISEGLDALLRCPSSGILDVVDEYCARVHPIKISSIMKPQCA